MKRRVQLLSILIVFVLSLATTTGSLDNEKDVDYRLGLVQINYNYMCMTTGFFVDKDGLIMTVAQKIQ
jgi:hypothetical protein